MISEAWFGHGHDLTALSQKQDVTYSSHMFESMHFHTKKPVCLQCETLVVICFAFIVVSDVSAYSSVMLGGDILEAAALPNLVSFNAAISACEKGWRWEDAVSVFQRPGEKDWEKDGETAQ